MNEREVRLKMVDHRSKKTAELVVFADHLCLEGGENADPVEVPREEVSEWLEFHDGIFLRRAVVVKIPKRKLFLLEPEAFATLSRWMGRHALLREAAKQRFAWALPIGVLYVILSLPMGSDPTSGIESFPFDPVSCFLGVSLVAVTVLARFFLNRVFFLLDSLWFLALAVDTVHRMITGATGPWALIFVLLQIFMVISGVMQFIRFSPSRFQNPPDRAPA